MQADAKNFNKALSLVLLWMVLFVMTDSGRAAGSAETIIAKGDGFTLTQSQFDEYRSAMVPDFGPNDKKGLLEAILRYELLSREYFNKQKEKGAESVPEASRTIEIKVKASKIYIQDVLNDYALADDVIESYYRSYPDKFRVGKTPGAVAGLLPLDDALKKEIKFIIVEKKKNIIIDEMVQNLISKSNIRIVNE